MKRILLALLICLVVGIFATGGLAWYVSHWYHAPQPREEAVTLLIESGTGLNRITDALLDAGVIDQAHWFKLIAYASKQHRRFKAGEYEFEAALSPEQVMGKLVRGESIIHAVTIPEGYRSQEIIDVLLRDDRLTGTVPMSIEEGTLMPDTYHFQRGNARSAIIERMQKQMKERMELLWNARADNLPVTTPQQAMVLASIVEKETGLPDERGHVASVFVNRLRLGMPLQSDPTVVYAIEREHGPMQRSLTREDWKYPSPYNTYYQPGLPPGPICHPGRAAIEAVLNPPHTQDLYFVATGNGGHFFAQTLDEHNRNIVRYKQAQQSERASDDEAEAAAGE